MADASQAPATKEDIGLLMSEIGKLYDATQRWKEEMVEAQEKWKNEIKSHFDVVSENIRYDAIGAQKDRIESHEDRIVRLEKHTRIAA